MLISVGIVAIYLGAANVWLVRYAETCTMGAADSLFGGAITLLCYLVGLACLWVADPPKRV